MDMLDLDEFFEGDESADDDQEGGNDSLAETGRYEAIDSADTDGQSDVMIAPELIFPSIELQSDDE